MPPDPSLDPGLVRRQVRVQAADAAWLRALLEGYEGLALLYGDGSGVLTLAAPCEREAELDAWLDDVARDLSLQVLAPGAAHGYRRRLRSPVTE